MFWSNIINRFDSTKNSKKILTFLMSKNVWIFCRKGENKRKFKEFSEYYRADCFRKKLVCGRKNRYDKKAEIIQGNKRNGMPLTTGVVSGKGAFDYYETQKYTRFQRSYCGQ